MSRIIQERLVFPNGIKCEWEDTKHGVRLDDEDVKQWVREANKKAKAEGSYQRFRSVVDDSGNSW